MKRYTKGTLATGVEKNLFSKEYELYGFATVEVRDRDRDLIRVKGFRGEVHKESPVKIVGTTHKYSAKEDGELPLVATVGEFVETTRVIKGATVPALAFGANYARNEAGDGVDTYAAKFKGKYDRRELDSFSIGLEAYKASPFKDGGVDVQDWDAFEISCCLVPRNPYATAISKLKSEFGDDFDPNAYIEERIIELQKSMDSLLRKGTESELLNKIYGRMDDVMCAIEALAIPAESQAGQQDGRIDPPDNDARFDSLAKALTELREQLAA